MRTGLSPRPAKEPFFHVFCSKHTRKKMLQVGLPGETELRRDAQNTGEWLASNSWPVPCPGLPGLRSQPLHKSHRSLLKAESTPCPCCGQI